MEALVKKTELVDAELVKAVGALLPGESLERILDETRNINLKRALNVVKSKKFATVIHLVEHLKSSNLPSGDISTVLKWVHHDEALPEKLRKTAKALLDAELLDSVFEFVCEIEEAPSPRKSSICCYRPLAD